MYVIRVKQGIIDVASVKISRGVVLILWIGMPSLRVFHFDGRLFQEGCLLGRRAPRKARGTGLNMPRERVLSGNDCREWL